MEAACLEECKGPEREARITRGALGPHCVIATLRGSNKLSFLGSPLQGP